MQAITTHVTVHGITSKCKISTRQQAPTKEVKNTKPTKTTTIVYRQVKTIAIDLSLAALSNC